MVFELREKMREPTRQQPLDSICPMSTLAVGKNIGLKGGR
jgi:hypothetical protein